MPEWLKKAELNNINFSEIIQNDIKEKLGIDKYIGKQYYIIISQHSLNGI